MLPSLRRLAPSAMLALCLFIFAIQTMRLDGMIGSDAAIFHAAVQRVLNDPALLYHDEQGVVATAQSLQGFLYPPASIAMLLPFGLGTLAQGHAILSTSALLAAVVGIWAWLAVAARDGLCLTSRLERVTLIMMAVVTGAVFTCRLGQVDTLILAIVTLGVWLGWQSRPGWGAAVLAFGAWIKIYPALLMLPLVARREARWPAMLGFAAGGFAVMLTALLVFPLAAWRDFFMMLPIMAERTIVNIDNQSVVAIWARTVVPAQQALTTYDAIVVPAPLRAMVSILAVGTIAAFMWRAHRSASSPLWVAAVATAIISLIAPLGWGHSYAYVLPLLILCIAVAWQARSWMALATALLIWAAFVIPSHRQFPHLDAGSLIWHIAYARYAIAAILLLGLGWWQMGRNGHTAANA